jgi:hypothetical protein
MVNFINIWRLKKMGIYKIDLEFEEKLYLTRLIKNDIDKIQNHINSENEIIALSDDIEIKKNAQNLLNEKMKELKFTNQVLEKIENWGE